MLRGSLTNLIATKTSQVEKNLEHSFATCTAVKGILAFLLDLQTGAQPPC